MSSEEQPKIIIDEDWKAQAKAEKEKLAAEAESKEQSATGPDGQPELPQASMVTLINQMAMQAVMSLGGMEDPETKKRIVDLGAAKFYIDTLAVLKEKTAGNLNEEEDKLLEQSLHELQMSFVALVQHVQQQQAGGSPDMAMPPQE